jgi:hypothetical protein
MAAKVHSNRPNRLGGGNEVRRFAPQTSGRARDLPTPRFFDGGSSARIRLPESSHVPGIRRFADSPLLIAATHGLNGVAHDDVTTTVGAAINLGDEAKADTQPTKKLLSHSVTESTQALPHFAQTHAIVTKLVDQVVSRVKPVARYHDTNLPDTVRADMVRDVLADIPEGFILSHDPQKAADPAHPTQAEINDINHKALNSVIDFIFFARAYDLIVSHPAKGGLTREGLSLILSVLFVHKSPYLRVDGSELKHVPLVTQGNLNVARSLWRAKHGSRLRGRKNKIAYRDRMMRAFIEGAIHDANKHNPDLLTQNGVLIGADGFLNASNKEIDVQPMESFSAALDRLGIAQDSVPKLRGLLPILIHQDGVSVHDFLVELVELGIISAENAEIIWMAVQSHAYGSGWVTNTSSGLQVQSRLFLEENFAPEFSEIFASLAKRISTGTPLSHLETEEPFATQIASLREAYQALPEDVRTMNAADNLAQLEWAKYLDIHAGQTDNHGFSYYELFFGRNRNDVKIHVRGVDVAGANSVLGTFRTNVVEIALYDPKLGANGIRIYEKIKAWAETKLPEALLADDEIRAAYDTWRLSYPTPSGFWDWLDTQKIATDGQMNPLHIRIRNAVENAYYDFYRPNLTTGNQGIFGGFTV